MLQTSLTHSWTCSWLVEQQAAKQGVPKVVLEVGHSDQLQGDLENDPVAGEGKMYKKCVHFSPCNLSILESKYVSICIKTYIYTQVRNDRTTFEKSPLCTTKNCIVHGEGDPQYFFLLESEYFGYKFYKDVFYEKGCMISCCELNTCVTHWLCYDCSKDITWKLGTKQERRIWNRLLLINKS